MSKPRIGVTYANAERVQPYLAALRQAGAEPVPIPVGSHDPLGLLDTLDGMLFPGGPDIDPKEYGESRRPDTQVDPELDELEIPLAKEVLRRGMPVLAICRGLQLVNVALGGSLYQDLGADGVTSKNHRTPKDQPRDLLADRVTIVAGSSWHALAGSPTVDVNTHHHQAVKGVAAGLRVTARSEDGVIEGLESADGLVLAIQCHPEELTAYPWARDLFRFFVEKTSAVDSRRSSS